MVIIPKEAQSKVSLACLTFSALPAEVSIKKPPHIKTNKAKTPTAPKSILIIWKNRHSKSLHFIGFGRMSEPLANALKGKRLLIRIKLMIIFFFIYFFKIILIIFWSLLITNIGSLGHNFSCCHVVEKFTVYCLTILFWLPGTIIIRIAWSNTGAKITGIDNQAVMRHKNSEIFMFQMLLIFRDLQRFWGFCAVYSI